MASNLQIFYHHKDEILVIVVRAEAGRSSSIVLKIALSGGLVICWTCVSNWQADHYSLRYFSVRRNYLRFLNLCPRCTDRYSE